MTPELTVALAIVSALVGVFNVILGFALYSMRDALRASDAKIVALERSHHEIELKLAREYHDKSELAAMFDEKLKPLNDLLHQVVKWIEDQGGGGPLPRSSSR